MEYSLVPPVSVPLFKLVQEFEKQGVKVIDILPHLRVLILDLSDEQVDRLDMGENLCRIPLSLMYGTAEFTFSSSSGSLSS